MWTVAAHRVLEDDVTTCPERLTNPEFTFIASLCCRAVILH